MPLSAGKLLGSYEILAIVGVGGMGEVYKARDTRLDRVVALKVLPEHVASDPDLRSRFEREAKAISSLSHPHICTLHDVGREAGVDFLVMEYLEGETAAQRLAKGSLPVQQVLRYGVEIAEALERAHRQGVTHRDLKPGNIMLTKSGVKLLDFGLAKLKSVPLERGAGNAPTAAADLTGSGTILGTLQYMAPEQVEGKAVDHRADIFAFGAVLYELATGKKAFEGASQASLIGAILRDEPQPISTLQPLSPPALDALVATCLAKDPDERWQSAADVGHQLKLMQGSASSSLRVGTARAAPPRAASWRPAAWALAMLLAGALLATAAQRMLARPPAVEVPLVSRFTIAPPAPAELTNVNPIDLDISRDGKRIAYFARSGDKTALYVRDLDQLESRIVTEVPAASSGPVFSPDGESIVFRSATEGFVRVGVDGLRSKIPYDSLFGAALAPDGTLVYSGGIALYRAPAAGGEPERLTPLPETADGMPPLYAAPRFLPDGRRLLFTLVDVDSGDERVGVVDLETREQRFLTEGAHPFFDRSGHLLFVRATTLMAAAFDPDLAVVTGTPVAVLQGIRHPNSASAVDYSLSENGTLIYVPAEISSPPRAVVWVDRSGRIVGRAVENPVNGAQDPRLSPDGRRLLLTTGPLQQANLWVYDLEGRPPVPLTAGGDNRVGIWSPDGTRVAFMRGGGGAGFYNVFSIASDGRDRAPTAVPTGLTLAGPVAWSRQGELILNRFVPSLDIVTYRAGEEPVRDLIATADSELTPALSPDERWLAYASNRTGRSEVWAMRYPDGNPIPVSSGGGSEPRWSRDGTELFFRQGAAMMAVAVDTESERPFGAAVKLFEEPRYLAGEQVVGAYDVAADRRFLMIEPLATTERAATGIVVIQNWSEELKRLMTAP